ncbi:MAG: hypothetical protein COT00_03160 [Candidatus Omnitrophica bacterium CG07_land_8_20_14_0_80_50_8]|nr:MAG: hypothetical protein AUJ71_04170 [Candidatus Omnitrophica bacterium CG1_02_49_16]PIU40154.1 MAG: hypothetical protein COT00_03160 [Candidatus Omnitrophica bacterium CG07_land_8_20_14_0_80_50_8]
MIAINLLPEALRKKDERVNLLAGLPIKRGAILCVIVFFGLQILGTIGAFYLSAHFTWMKAEASRLKEANKSIASWKLATVLIKKKKEKAAETIQRPFLWSALINALSDSVTKGVWLKNFSVTQNGKTAALKLEGSVVGKGEETAYAGKFIKELKDNMLFGELFSAIELKTINQKRIKDIDVYDFVILCTFKKGQR